MKTIEEVIDKMKNYYKLKTNKMHERDNDDITIAFCDGVIQSLGWAYDLPYWDMDSIGGKNERIL